MKLEKELVQLQNLQLKANAEGGSLTILPSHRSFQLNKLQFSYLEILKSTGSIEGIVNFFLGQGWLVSFRELYTLLEFLVREKIVLNPTFQTYFSRNQNPSEGAQTLSLSQTSLGKAVNPRQLLEKKLPFFRSLDPELALYLLQKSEHLQISPNTRLVQSGATDRDLFILLRGQAAIYRVFGENKRQLISTLEAGALFGERGFLLNQQRTADIITTQPSEILRVRHLPEFDQLIKSEKALSLQHRFWVLQALQSSPFFKDLPGDSIDSLIFTGRLCQAPAHQVLFREGQPGNTCYILVQGNVVVSQGGRNINVLKTGSCFGEISLLVSGGRRTATVTTQQDSVLLEIQQNDFYRVLGQNLLLARDLETLAQQRLANDASRS